MKQWIRAYTTIIEDKILMQIKNQAQKEDQDKKPKMD